MYKPRLKVISTSKRIITPGGFGVTGGITWLGLVRKLAECRIGVDFLSGKAIFSRNPGGFQEKSTRSWREKTP